MFVVIAQHKLASIMQTKGAGCLPFEMCAVLCHKTEEDEFIVCKEMVSGEILLGIEGVLLHYLATFHLLCEEGRQLPRNIGSGAEELGIKQTGFHVSVCLHNATAPQSPLHNTSAAFE